MIINLYNDDDIKLIEYINKYDYIDENGYIDIDNMERIEKEKYIIMFKKTKSDKYKRHNFYETFEEADHAYNTLNYEFKFIALADTTCVNLLGEDFLDTCKIKKIIK